MEPSPLSALALDALRLVMPSLGARVFFEYLKQSVASPWKVLDGYLARSEGRSKPRLLEFSSRKNAARDAHTIRKFSARGGQPQGE